MFMHEKTKLNFFLSLQSLAESGKNQLIMSERAKVKLGGEELHYYRARALNRKF